MFLFYSLRVCVCTYCLYLSFGSHQLHLCCCELNDHSVRCSMSWKDFRLAVVIVVILMCSINSQRISRTKKQKNTTESYKCNAYLPTDLCHAFAVIFFFYLSCQFLFFFSVVREMMNTVAPLLPPANYFPFFALFQCDVCFFNFSIFFSVVACCQMKYFMGLCTFMWINQKKGKKPVTF